MEEIYGEFAKFFEKPAIVETFVDILVCAVPIWVAVMIGLVIGWSWRPRWTGLLFLGLRSRLRYLWTAPPGFGARRLWFAFTALSAFSLSRRLWSNFKGKGDANSIDASAHTSEKSCASVCPISEALDGDQDVVTEKDLKHLLYLLEGKDSESAWQQMMERITPNMAYHAWRNEPEAGPVIYRSRTVFEDATPELVRDFFWDDDFRSKWDPMLAYFKTLEECPLTGEMIAHWIKKFPFFCSDREYIIGRRIWESSKTYYCVTKGVPYPKLPKNEKPRRVELYYSSWRIRAVESRKGDGQLTACEVALVHYEDMGIPRDVAKLGVRHGMWGAVKKLHSGMRAYQLARRSDASLSQCALMAHRTTKIPIIIDDNTDNSTAPAVVEEDTKDVDQGVQWKWLVIGGTVAVVCGLHTRVIGKALLMGGVRKLARN